LTWGGEPGVNRFHSPWWLPGGDLQTIVAARLIRPWRGERPTFSRERWVTPDGDFIDVDFLEDAPPKQGWLVLFHGLEGSSQGHYSLAFAEAARAAGLAMAVPHFRGCSGEPNRAPRAYHSGDHEEIGWMLARLRERSSEPLRAVGISLGGNALLRWAQVAGESAAATVHAVAAISAPVDLTAAGHAIDQGFNRMVYARMFLSTMVPKALAMLQRHPGLFDGERLARARTMFTFDDAFTAPVHGFAGALDYWQRASAKPHLKRLRVPALLLNARNDPFVPGDSLPQAADAGPMVTLWQPASGGHVGFVDARWPAGLGGMPQAVLSWFDARKATPFDTPRPAA
jgi:predicted alpha/beta-fold hydrolase